MRDDDLDFYSDLALKYFDDVDQMAYEKKRTFLRRLLKKSGSDDACSVERRNSASDVIDSYFDEF
jgi:hypothetical protein